MSIRNVGEKESGLRRAGKDCIAAVVYWMYQHHILHMKHEIHVMTVAETIQVLLHSEKSLVRFGDGEFAMMRGVNLALQMSDAVLTGKMQEILRNEDPELIVTIPEIFDSLSMYRKQSRKFWKDHLLFCRKFYDRYCVSELPYGSTSFSRPYITASTEEKKKCADYFRDIRAIWKGRKLFVIEGTATHNGVGNDLFSEAMSVRRLICPPRNAYDHMAEIMDTALKLVQPDEMALVSLGPAAKPLVMTLHQKGIRTLDIGNLDKEYEWFLMKAEDKCALPKNGVLGRKANVEAGYTEYLDQIVGEVGLTAEMSLKA